MAIPSADIVSLITVRAPNKVTATLPTATLLPRPVKAAPQSMASAKPMFVRVPRKVIVRLPTAIFLLQTAKVPA